MGQTCQCDCDDGQHELYQELVLSQKSPEQRQKYLMNNKLQANIAQQIQEQRNPQFNPNLKPLKRAKIQNNGSEYDYQAQDFQYANEKDLDSDINSRRPTQLFNNGQSFKNSAKVPQSFRSSSIMDTKINQQNAFQQTYEDLAPKLRKDIPSLIFVPNYVFPNGSMYKGQMVIDKQRGIEERCGYGVQIWTDGAVYEGNWIENKAEGKGTFWHAEGDIYIGEFKADQASGFGVYTHMNGSRYEGEWVNDVQQGQGEETWIDGAKYVGHYQNGMKHGYGVYTWADGSEFKGNWDQNKISGYGIYYWEDGRVYNGYWKENNMHGQGHYKWPDGRQYEGRYVDDKKDGYGVYTYPDGRCYKGMWKDGKQHGEGVFISPDGTQRKGEWKNGKRLFWLDEQTSEQNRDSVL